MVTPGDFGGSVDPVTGPGALGYQVLPHGCNCDDPGLDALVNGALVGSAIGAALGAAAANLHSVCSFNRRLKRTLLGSALAATAAYFVAGGSGNEGTLIAVPAGAIGGSLGALGECWKSRS